MFRNCGTYSVERYNNLEAQRDELEGQLEELRDLYIAMDDEDEAEDLYGEDIADLEQQIEWLDGEMGAIDNHWLTRDYYASVL